MQFSKDTQDRIQYWRQSSDFDEPTRKEVQDLWDEQNQEELNNRFYKELEFGTGGMRGIMGAGSCRINIPNIRKATTALVHYLKEAFPCEKDTLKVAVTYDSRLYSKDFAQIACEVLASHQVVAILTSEMRPVPFLSFMVRQTLSHAGICMTASHNPKEYNGFKVYWRSGGQLVSPHAEGITSHFEQLTCYGKLTHLPFEQALAQGWIRMELSTLDEGYFHELRKLPLFHGPKESLRIVYTPLHGTGGLVVPRALREFGFTDLHIVPSQATPDGHFPTVFSPNPEDTNALVHALEHSTKVGGDVILATDPDSDRVGVVVREHGHWKWFNGNQMGCLLYEYILSQKSAHGVLPKDGLIVKTVVTTELQRDIAQQYGLTCEDTLTGFKWICDLIESYENGSKKPYKAFICGGEESCGFLMGTFVRDKDAVMSCALIAEMVAYYKHKGQTLSEVLDVLFVRHHLYEERLFVLTLPGQAGAQQIASIMDAQRARAPSALQGKTLQEMKDYKTLEHKFLTYSSAQSAKVTHIDAMAFPRTDLLQFVLEDATLLSLRPSGTEPKLKLYLSGKRKVTTANLEHERQDLQAHLIALEQEFSQILLQSTR